MIHRSAFFLLAFAHIQMAALPAHAENREESIETFIASIDSVEVAKTEIRNALAESDNCRHGSCVSFYFTEVCNIVAALDVNVAGKILEERTMTGGESKFAISSSDVRSMRQIFEQCKPTNYQYWNHDELIHVEYSPDEKSSVEIDKYLGID